MSAAENIATSNNAPAVQFGSNGDAIAPTPSMPTSGFYDSFNLVYWNSHHFNIGNF